ncbi:MAG TPA: NAD(P)/FAD-dependent oxidoreductase, partial [Candidatus Lokiarchaeia archaeon]|nr:NAD(P)/FAD-dependent oxidoreductase [Candidatus Lokiarchaeia archaeon]
MDADVIIVGAGPVGLLLANLLGSCGVSTLVIEREIKRRPGSRAIGVSPPSLQILRQIGLDEKFVQNGIKGVRVSFHGTRAYLGSIKIRSLPTPYPYLLALPQATTESYLEGNLGNYPVVTVMRGWKCPGVENLLDHVRVHLQNVVDNTDTTLTAKFAVGCDGAHSCVR